MNKLGQGIKEDIARRFKFYKSDYTDGFHYKSLSSSFFLFFACLAPAVTFGGILGIYTDGAMGAVEMILASAICGIVFAFISGQPLTILGGTGPMLVITAMLFQLSNSLGLEFLSAYFWVGIWTAILTMIAAVTNLSKIMKYFTRFTDEIFAALISVIFIYEAVNSIRKTFLETDTIENHSVAFLTLLLALGTFVIANGIAHLRKTRFLNRFMREFLSDFGPVIAISCMTLVALNFQTVNLASLPAPSEFGSTSGREWLVDIWALPVWARWASIIPAFFVTILVFLDQNITARLINTPEHKLSKGDSYHWDMLLVGVLIGICSLFGLPWLVAATVRSLNHVRGLAVFKDIKNADGTVENKIISTRETRISGLLIHMMLGGALLVLPMIKLVPMAILYGLFLYMGIVSMKGNQFFERLSLWFMDPELYPEKHYTHKIPMKTIHKFTLIQLLGLIILWVIKVSPAGILFPLFIALLVPLRTKLTKYFSSEQLDYLDSEEEASEEVDHWST
jgi:hypothetical protein